MYCIKGTCYMIMRAIMKAPLGLRLKEYVVPYALDKSAFIQYVFSVKIEYTDIVGTGTTYTIPVIVASFVSPPTAKTSAA